MARNPQMGVKMATAAVDMSTGPVKLKLAVNESLSARYN